MMTIYDPDMMTMLMLVYDDDDDDDVDADDDHVASGACMMTMLLGGLWKM